MKAKHGTKGIKKIYGRNSRAGGPSAEGRGREGPGGGGGGGLFERQLMVTHEGAWK